MRAKKGNKCTTAGGTPLEQSGKNTERTMFLSQKHAAYTAECFFLFSQFFSKPRSSLPFLKINLNRNKTIYILRPWY